ncbi:hypothetical protein F383_09780 [Gossypium arboreum]|uniref:Uncharacterized protein n=1 Tax=Gossypium arboreum TaxID=29729 RepID=A0A0B0NYC4_GOSAR|nr:hypothetical protein F383_09780 [Gossypium arboreum]
MPIHTVRNHKTTPGDQHPLDLSCTKGRQFQHSKFYAPGCRNGAKNYQTSSICVFLLFQECVKPIMICKIHCIPHR